MSKILVISTSLRVNSNSEVLANEFVRGAKDAGNDVEVLSLKKKKHRILPRLPDMRKTWSLCYQR